MKIQHPNAKAFERVQYLFVSVNQWLY